MVFTCEVDLQAALTYISTSRNEHIPCDGIFCSHEFFEECIMRKKVNEDSNFFRDFMYLKDRVRERERA